MVAVDMSSPFAVMQVLGEGLTSQQFCIFSEELQIFTHLGLKNKGFVADLELHNVVAYSSFLLSFTAMLLYFQTAEEECSVEDCHPAKDGQTNPL